MSSAAAVDVLIAAGGSELAELMQAVEGRMLEVAGGFGEQLGGPARETILAGGKRLRPLLVCLASGVPVRAGEALLRAAVAVELVHAATLVHDDVIDGAALRRGRPTVVATHGREVATATGDLLFSRAFHELAGGERVEPVRILSRAANELAAGELLQREDAWNAAVTVDRYLERCRLKTAALFRAACELGALAGSGDPPGLGAFGEAIGLAFQLLDDVLDVTGPPERTGKPRGADLLDGTVTLPLIEAMASDPDLASLDLRTITTASQAAAVCDAIERADALRPVRMRALGFVADAKALLPKLPGPQRAALELVADGVVERYS